MLLPRHRWGIDVVWPGPVRAGAVTGVSCGAGAAAEVRDRAAGRPPDLCLASGDEAGEYEADGDDFYDQATAMGG